MKAISVRQPWAQLIIQNRKTVEVRNLDTNYRGQLLIHAAVVQDRNEFKKANIDIESINSFEYKKIIGIVDLVDVVKFTPTLWEELRERHLLPGKWSEIYNKYAWYLENPRPINPIAYTGLPALFSVDPQIVSKILADL